MLIVVLLARARYRMRHLGVARLIGVAIVSSGELCDWLSRCDWQAPATRSDAVDVSHSDRAALSQALLLSLWRSQSTSAGA